MASNFKTQEEIDAEIARNDELCRQAFNLMQSEGLFASDACKRIGVSYSAFNTRKRNGMFGDEYKPRKINRQPMQQSLKLKQQEEPKVKLAQKPIEHQVLHTNHPTPGPSGDMQLVGTPRQLAEFIGYLAAIKTKGI